jgi:hypothetical protein
LRGLGDSQVEEKFRENMSEDKGGKKRKKKNIEKRWRRPRNENTVAAAAVSYSCYGAAECSNEVLKQKNIKKHSERSHVCVCVCVCVRLCVYCIYSSWAIRAHTHPCISFVSINFSTVGKFDSGGARQSHIKDIAARAGVIIKIVIQLYYFL